MRTTVTKTYIKLGMTKCHKASLYTQHMFAECAVKPSCNNVAPVTNLCLGRATTRSHSSQWSKKKVAVET